MIILFESLSSFRASSVSEQRNVLTTYPYLDALVQIGWKIDVFWRTVETVQYHRRREN